MLSRSTPSSGDSGRDLGDRLRSIGVTQNPVLVGDLRDCRDRLDRADLVVGVHHADEDRLGRDRAPDVIWVDEAVPVDRHGGDPRTEPLDEATGFDDGRVFHRRRDQVWRRRRRAEHRPLDDVVVGFAAAAGQQHLVGITLQQERNLTARCLDRVTGGLAGPVPARRVPEVTVEEGPHDGRHLRRDRRAGVEVEIDVHVPLSRPELQA